MISVNRALQDTVGIGHALVLTQMLKPRFNEEMFPDTFLLRLHLRRHPMHTRRHDAAHGLVFQERSGMLHGLRV